MALNVSVRGLASLRGENGFLTRLERGDFRDTNAHVLFLGDSYTAGYGANNPREDAYASILTRRLKALAGRDGGTYLSAFAKKRLWDHESLYGPDAKGFLDYYLREQWIDPDTSLEGDNYSWTSNWRQTNAVHNGGLGGWSILGYRANPVNRSTLDGDTVSDNAYMAVTCADGKDYLFKVVTTGDLAADYTGVTYPMTFGATVTDGTAVIENLGYLNKTCPLPPAKTYRLFYGKGNTTPTLNIDFEPAIPSTPYTLDSSATSLLTWGNSVDFTMPAVASRKLKMTHGSGYNYVEGVLCLPDADQKGLIDYRLGMNSRCLADIHDAIGAKPARANSTAYAKGDWYTSGGYTYTFTVAGTTAASPPTLTTTRGATTVDGTATVMCTGTDSAVTNRPSFVGEHVIPESDPVLVVIMLGVNDYNPHWPLGATAQQTPLATAQAILKDLIKAYTEVFTDVSFVYVIPPPFSTGGVPTTLDMQYNYMQALGDAAMAATDATGAAVDVAVVDLSQIWGLSAAAWTSAGYSWDGLHPNTTAHAYYAEGIAQALALADGAAATNALEDGDRAYLDAIKAEILAAMPDATQVDQLHALEFGKKVRYGGAVPTAMEVLDADDGSRVARWNITGAGTSSEVWEPEI